MGTLLLPLVLPRGVLLPLPVPPTALADDEAEVLLSGVPDSPPRGLSKLVGREVGVVPGVVSLQ